MFSADNRTPSSHSQTTRQSPESSNDTRTQRATAI